MSRAHDIDGINAGFTWALYEEYLESRDRVPAVWREYFENGAGDAVVPVEAIERDELEPAAIAAAMSLVMAYRTHGHLMARLDPLGAEPVGDPALEPEGYVPSLTPKLQARIPAAHLGLSVPANSLSDALPRLRETYCGTIAYELEHIANQEKRAWLRQTIESGRYRRPLPPEEKIGLLGRLSRVEAFERFLRQRFFGQKQFSIEGLDVLVPMLDAAIEIAAEAGARSVVIGMPHRGRLNALAHVVGRPYADILAKFEAEPELGALVADGDDGTGDVKYHLGGKDVRRTRAGEVSITLLPNPSHLEAVDPVVEGFVRAEQTERSASAGLHDPSSVLPILVHGDASFAGQGVVAETFNLAGLGGYTTGGTLHVIANNQVGFTTDPGEGRSTRYASDLAKGFDVPIVHVNADDPEAALSAVRLAIAYREKFGHDFVIDLVGYRRLGHNEQDDPSYTQPLTAGLIERHPTARELYARRLLGEGIVPLEEADDLVDSVLEELRYSHEELKAASGRTRPPSAAARIAPTIVTAVPDEKLRALDEELVRVPSAFTVNPKLARQLARRRNAIDEGGIDWGHAEALALASLVGEGIPIRLAGQDSQRGTFSHRHLVLHDATNGEMHAPIQHLPGANASIEVCNSPLSEYAALGFEYGYSVAAPDALVLWEAQFGDFVNGAQIVVDQFIAAGRSKWGQTSRLTLLLPHGYEGNGPEHSSARLERFLQSAAEENIRVANPSTAAQYFHLLRRQARDLQPRPLIVMTPKGLLRSRAASANLRQLAGGAFAPVLFDPTVDREQVRRLVLCSGKLYYDIAAHDERARLGLVAIARLEQLYPFPERAVAELVAEHPAIEELVWAQEEPLNMGAYRSIRHRLEEALPESVPLRFVGRPWRASPSEGYRTAHVPEQERIVREALGKPQAVDGAHGGRCVRRRSGGRVARTRRAMRRTLRPS